MGLLKKSLERRMYFSAANSYWKPVFGGREMHFSRILQAYMAHFEDTARQAALQLLLKPQKLSKAPGYSIGGRGLGT